MTGDFCINFAMICRAKQTMIHDSRMQAQELTSMAVSWHNPKGLVFGLDKGHQLAGLIDRY
jgi:hypothetical protein